MIRSDRVRDLLDRQGLSQSELARRVNVTQGAIAKIVSRNPGGSAHLHKIARALGTSPSYLTGEIDDPTEGAPPPLPAPAFQFLTLPVALPSEAALAAAFEGLLLASPGMAGAELAHELARRLPTLLRVAAGALAAQPSAGLADRDEDPAALDDERRAPRRASRT